MSQTFWTILVALATVATAAATLDYARYQREPSLSAFFETDGTWIFLVIQNTGSDVARNTRFALDLSSQELAEIFGPNQHGQRYIVYQDLSFLSRYTYLAPSQVIRHQWLYKPFALRDKKPRDCTFTISYDDRWGFRHEVQAPFAVGMFGTWDHSFVSKPQPAEVLAKELREIRMQLETLNRRETLLHRRRSKKEAELERAEWTRRTDSGGDLSGRNDQ